MARSELSDREVCTIKSALALAAEQYEKSEFVKLAEYIRAGNDYPMFAKGEPGAIAADRLSRQFSLQAEDARKLSERIDTFDRVVLVAETERA